MNLQTWLQNLGLEQYSQAFTDNEVDFAILPKLTAEDLKEIGVSAVGHRRKLLEAIASLAPEQAPNPTSVNTTVSAERRNLTVMFVDLVGSTQLSTRLDPEDMRSIILTYQKQVAEEIARVGGNVAKFMGDGVLAYFGWPQAHENEAERAVRAGLAISKSISQQKDPTGATLAARVGIATGLVVVGDLIGSGSAQEETVVGDTPNLAARLQSFAEPAQVVISDSTFRQLHGMFDVSNLGGLQLKGIAQRQTAYAVLAERPLESRFAARATSGGYTPLIGREAELGLLASKWLLAKDDQVALALVTGEAGIGKSRLVEALIEQAKTQPFKLIRVQCAPHHSASALHPFINQIQISAQLQPTDTLAERNLKLDRILAPYEKEDRFLLLSVLGEKPEQLENMASLSPQQLRYRTLQALLLHFTHKSEAQPILLVFEDAHWADPSSVEFLAMLLETSGGGIFLLLTARPEFKSVIAAHPAASTIVLNRLARNHTAEIAKLSTTGIDIPEDLLQEIVRKSDGVPLYIEEMTRAAQAVSTKPGQLNVLNHVPETLHDSLMSRLDQLPTGKETAQIASVIGRAFDYMTLSTISPLAATSLEKDLTSLSNAELVFRRGMIPDASYIFKHALVRDAAYQSLLKSKRQQYHASLLNTLETRSGTSPEILAHHAEHALQQTKAIEYWGIAGDSAMARPAYHEAISHYRHAVELQSTEQDASARETELALRTKLGLASIAAKGHSHPETKDIFESSLKLSESVARPDLNFVTWYGIWCGDHVAGTIPRALKSSQKLFAAAKMVGTPSHVLMGTRALAISSLMSGDYITAQTHHQTALQHRDITRDREFVKVTGQDQHVSFNSYFAINLWALGHMDESWERAADSVAVAKEVGHVNSLGYAYMHATLLALLQARPERECYIDEMLEFTTEHRLELWHGHGLQFKALFDLLHDADSAIAQLKRVRKSLRDGNAGLFAPTIAIEAANQLLSIDRLSEALLFLEDARSSMMASRECFSEPELLRVEGLAQSQRGNQDQAEILLTQALELATARQARHWARLAEDALLKIRQKKSKT